ESVRIEGGERIAGAERLELASNVREDLFDVAGRACRADVFDNPVPRGPIVITEGPNGCFTLVAEGGDGGDERLACGVAHGGRRSGSDEKSDRLVVGSEMSAQLLDFAP